MRGGAAVVAIAVGTAWCAVAGCAHDDQPRPAAPQAAPRIETPDEIVMSCARSGGAGSCSSLAQELKQLLARGMDDDSFFALMMSIGIGGSGGLSHDGARAVRAVVSNSPIAENVAAFDALTRDLTDYNKRDRGWKISEEGQGYFIDRTLRRAVAVRTGGQESKRRVGALAERMEATPSN
jgi:hypothetical protein